MKNCMETHFLEKPIFMLLRSASPKDTIALLSLIIEAFNRTTNDSFTEQYFDPSYRHTLVAVEADTNVATATLHYVQKIDRIMGQIEDVVVSSDYRGRGLGRLLVEELLKKAIEKGIYTEDQISKIKNL